MDVFGQRVYIFDMVYNMMNSFITISLPVYNNIDEENHLVGNELASYIVGQTMYLFGIEYNIVDSFKILSARIQ